MKEWTIHWTSSRDERYGGEMLTKADSLVKDSGLTVVEEFGGSAIGVSPDDPTGSDNGYVIESDDELAVRRLAGEISNAVGHEVRVNEYSDA